MVLPLLPSPLLSRQQATLEQGGKDCPGCNSNRGVPACRLVQPSGIPASTYITVCSEGATWKQPALFEGKAAFLGWYR